MPNIPINLYDSWALIESDWPIGPKHFPLPLEIHPDPLCLVGFDDEPTSNIRVIYISDNSLENESKSGAYIEFDQQEDVSQISGAFTKPSQSDRQAMSESQQDVIQVIDNSLKTVTESRSENETVFENQPPNYSNK